MLDELAVNLVDRVVFRSRALCYCLKYVKFVLTDYGFSESSALFNIVEPGAYSALLSEQVAFVLDYHFNRRFKLAYRAVVCSC